jgi:tRNA A58 N-methylase Trm61
MDRILNEVDMDSMARGRRVANTVRVHIMEQVLESVTTIMSMHMIMRVAMVVAGMDIGVGRRSIRIGRRIIEAGTGSTRHFPSLSRILSALRPRQPFPFLWWSA